MLIFLYSSSVALWHPLLSAVTAPSFLCLSVNLFPGPVLCLSPASCLAPGPQHGMQATPPSTAALRPSEDQAVGRSWTTSAGLGQIRRAGGRTGAQRCKQVSPTPKDTAVAGGVAGQLQHQTDQTILPLAFAPRGRGRTRLDAGVPQTGLWDVLKGLWGSGDGGGLTGTQVAAWVQVGTLRSGSGGTKLDGFLSPQAGLSGRVSRCACLALSPGISAQLPVCWSRWQAPGEGPIWSRPPLSSGRGALPGCGQSQHRVRSGPRSRT